MNNLLGLPPLVSQHGLAVDQLLAWVHILMLILFVGWLAYFLFVLFRFRRRKHPTADYHGVRGHFSSYLEVVVAVIEGVLLVGFSIPIWARAVDKFPAEKEATVVRVTAEQFAWNGRYAGADGVFGRQDVRFVSSENPTGLDPDDTHGKDDIVTLNQFYVPVNKPVIVHLTSKDVIHSFSIKPMRVIQDAIPGMSIPLWFIPNKIGLFEINCAQLCGNSHYRMRGYLNVVSQADYDQWIAQKSKAGPAQSYE